jgi:hypothetical protein
MDHRRTIHSKRRHIAAIHQIYQDWRKTSLDDVPAKTDDYRALLVPGGSDQRRELAKLSRSEYVWQSVQEAPESQITGGWLGEVIRRNFAGPRG